MKANRFENVDLSDVGNKRKNNEDALLSIPERGVFCVADGMGGVVGGDLASEAIVTRLQEAFARPIAEKTEDFSNNLALFRQAANAASKWIREFAEDKVIGQMGSTLVALIFDPNNPRQAVGLHAGDSRLYRYRDGKLHLLTSDHTAAASLVAKGHDLAKIPEKYHNELVRAVGLAETVELEKTLIEVASGDLFLLCSDGLTRMLSEPSISKILKRNDELGLNKVAKNLISKANEAGGKDNITVILIKMGDLSGYPTGMAPDELDEAQTVAAPVDLDGNILTLGAAPKPVGADSDESFQAHTPQTDDTPTLQGNTPRTPELPKLPLTSIKRPGTERDTGEKEIHAGATRKTGIGKSGIIGLIIAALALVGVSSHYLFSLHSKLPNDEWPQRPSPFAQADPTIVSSNPLNAGTAIKSRMPLTGSLTIQSKPTGADVFLLGRRVGMTPFETNRVPVGEVSFTLATMTHTGLVNLLVKAGQISSTNITLTPRYGILTIHSDPTGAEVFLGNEKKGITPVSLVWPAGQAVVNLKYGSLIDQTTSIVVTASKTNEMNVVFARGSVVVKSQPEGAEVQQHGIIAGQSPYTNNMVPPGLLEWRVAKNGWQTTNVSMQVFNHQMSVTTVILQKEKGMLQLTNALSGINASVDGASVGTLPANVSVDASVGHTVTAEHNGIRKTNLNVMIQSGKTRIVAFNFPEKPQYPLRWTNHFGMVFVKLPGTNAWAAVRRVTLKQFTSVMSKAPVGATEIEEKGQSYIINLTREMTTNFTAKLTGMLRDETVPMEVKGYRFALPTVDQWEATFTNASRLGIEITNLTSDKEWCLDGNLWSMAGYVQNGEGDDSKQEAGHRLLHPQPGEEPRRLALRLVFEP